MGDNLQISKLKIKNLQKWTKFILLDFKRFTGCICRLYAFLCKKKSLSNTEILEDVAEDFVGGDFASDFADVLKTLAEVQRQEVAGDVAGKAVVHTAR